MHQRAVADYGCIQPLLILGPVNELPLVPALRKTLQVIRVGTHQLARLVDEERVGVSVGTETQGIEIGNTFGYTIDVAHKSVTLGGQ